MFGPESTATGRPRTSVESRSPRRRVEPLRQASTGARRAAPRRPSGTPARHATTTSSAPERRVGDVARRRRQVDVARSAGCGPSRRSPRASAARARERHVVPRSASRRANAVPHAPPPTTTAVHERAPEVDRDRHALELEPLAQLVLDPVAVVARHEARVVDGEAEARRPRRDLRAVQQVQPACALRRRLARLLQLAEEAVQLGGRDAARVLVVELADLVEQARDARGRSSPRW